MVGDVHMKVSVHTASHIDTQLAIARVRDRDRVRVRVKISCTRVYQPRVAIHTATSEASRIRAKLAVCTASAVSHQGVVTVRRCQF